MVGPIDFIVVGFKDNKFSGGILNELSNAVQKGIIRVICLTGVIKDENGNLSTIDFSADADATTLNFTQSNQLHNDLVTDDDIAEVGEALENNSAAGLLIIEHLWAKGLKSAILDAGGTLMAEGRLHPDATKEIEEEL